MIRMEAISKKKELEVGLNDIFIVLISFFISRVSILNELTPFGIAFLGTYLIMKKANVALLLSVLLGMFTIHGLSGSSYYMIGIVTYFIFSNVLKEREYTLLKSSLMLGLIFLNSSRSLITLLLKNVSSLRVGSYTTTSIPLALILFITP